MPRSKIYFIYHKLQLEENLALIARVLKNCNFLNIRLSQAKFELPSTKAQMGSRGAENIISSIQSFDSFDEAILDLNYLFATSKRQRNLQNIMINAKSASLEIAQLLSLKTPIKSDCQKPSKNINNQIKIGVAFGCEASGLTNLEIAKANKQIYYNLNSDFASLNISHATAILAYLINMQITNLEHKNEQSMLDHKKVADLATKKEINNLIVKLVGELDKKNYYSSTDIKPTMVLNLTNLLHRSNLSSSEVQSLQNVLKYLVKK